MERGFSLVELSIVLVILGLLTGGILAGQSLIRASELRAVSTEFHRYVSATHAFRDKYFAMPGDMTNATKFWDSAGGDGSNYACQSTPSTTATCNGNGDGYFGWPTAVIPGGTSSQDMGVAASELIRFWQHLSYAGLIEGRFNGMSNPNPAWAYSPAPNADNSPRSKFANAFWALRGRSVEPYAGTASNFANPGVNHEFTLNDGSSAITIAVAPFPFFKPEEAWNLDTKMDDGRPNVGKVTAIKTNCTNMSGVAPPGDANAAYALERPDRVCGMIYAFK